MVWFNGEGKHCLGKKGETGGKFAVNFQCCLLHAIIFGWKPDTLLRNKENWKLVKGSIHREGICYRWQAGKDETHHAAGRLVCVWHYSVGGVNWICRKGIGENSQICICIFWLHFDRA